MMNKYSIYMVNSFETPHNWKSLLLAKMMSSVVGCGESECTMPVPEKRDQNSIELKTRFNRTIYVYNKTEFILPIDNREITFSSTKSQMKASPFDEPHTICESLLKMPHSIW